TDGMRFEFPQNHATYYFNKLHESDVLACTTVVKSASSTANQTLCGGCGSYGLNNNPDLTTKPPCLIAVDVNGDRKPTPRNLNCQTDTCGWHKNSTSVPHPNDKKVTDLFSILITDKEAIPYGIVAQKAMYNSQK
ncbi:MAG: hypothetical protein Q4F80_03675, partial [bacterium]|nr:hypothetical protein [bacterium]